MDWNRTVRHIGSKRILPNKSFHNPNFYNIKSISDLQTQVLISNLQYKLSDPIINPYINIELTSLQKTNCVPTCILQDPSHIFSINTNSFSLKLAQKNNIKFCTPNLCNHNLPGSFTPLFI